MSFLLTFIFSAPLFFLTGLSSAFANAPNAPTFFCPADQLRVARCERLSNDSDSAKGVDTLADLVVEQMLLCQDKDKQFSLQARYVSGDLKTVKETAPIPASPTRLGNDSTFYTTITGLNLVLSANRQQAVFQQCIQGNGLRQQQPGSNQGETSPPKKEEAPVSNCQERLAVCK